VPATVSRRVKGSLFLAYVRMIRSAKNADWTAHLRPEDEVFLHQRIDPGGWYPMETFERMGLGILAVIARGNLEAVQAWGRFQIDDLRAARPDLIVAGDPAGSLRHFETVCGDFFDFGPLRFLEVAEGEAAMRIEYGMSKTAEEAASFQTLGFLERLVELAGARPCGVRFRARSWAGDPATIAELGWEMLRGSRPPGG
jgi:hypothetical protein